MSTDFNMAQWTADDLLAEVLAACRFPATGTVDYTPAVVLRRATDSIWGWATHHLSTARDGRMAAALTRDVATQFIDSDGDEFELPPMAVADTLESVTYQSRDGGGQLRLQLIPLGQEALYTDPASQDMPHAYTLIDGRVKVIPKPTSGGKIKITYLRRHGQLVPAADPSTQIIASLTSGGTGNAPMLMLSTGSGFAVGQWVDIINRYYPYRTKLHGALITDISTITGAITLGNEDLTAVQQLNPVGDILAVYGNTRFVHLPLEMRVSLTKRIAHDILNEIGDVQLANQYAAFAADESARTRDMLSPRVKSDREKVINRHSLARRSVVRGWWR